MKYALRGITAEESTEAEPKPFNLKARLVGIFEAEDVNTDEDRQVLAISTTEIVYPYLRAVVSSLTANAFINPLILPVIPAEASSRRNRLNRPTC